MRIEKCEKGHYYDADANASCPQCAAEAEGNRGIIEDCGATEPVSAPVNGWGNGGFSPAGAPNMDAGGRGETLPPSGMHGFSGWDETNAPSEVFSGEETIGFSDRRRDVDNYSDATRPVNPNSVPGFMPVVGWLVCVDGPDKGNDFRIRTGYNHIGRAEYMDICIRGDMQISREKHALIGYDDQEKVFFFGPSAGRNLVRVNGKMVMVPTELHPYDTVTVGSSKLIFVPLCGDHFDWS